MQQRLVAGIKNLPRPRLGHRPHAPISDSLHAFFSTSRTISEDANSSTPYGQLDATKAPGLIDKAFPRSRFGRSIFTTPALLILRLFYQATSFDHYHVPAATSAPRATIWQLYRKASSALKGTHSADYVESLDNSRIEGVVDLASKTSTDSWPSLLQSQHYPLAPSSTLQSMTWVKSLSAPLSHEYLQFVVECNNSGNCYRLVAERDTDGDWAYFIASDGGRGESSSPANKINQLRPYDYQHDLPLPLLSVSWSQVPLQNRPTIEQLAKVLAQTSLLCPKYNVIREHCWWYAELVFEEIYGVSANKPPPAGAGPSDDSQPVLKHWPSGAYRYSYIVLGQRMMRRDILIEQAKAFRDEMNRDGQLQW